MAGDNIYYNCAYEPQGFNRASMNKTISGLLALGVGAILAGCGGEATAAPTPTIDPASEAGEGLTLFQQYCGACHATAEGVVIVGPPLAHIATTAETRIEGLSAEEYLREAILYPNSHTVDGFVEGTMRQDFAQVLTSEEVDQLIAYMMTLE